MVILGGAMGLTAVGALPVATAFFTAAVLIVLLGALSLREAYEAVDWPILVMLGALIPVSEAIRTTGGADLLAGWLSQLASTLPSYGALALIMVAAMAVTPFLNNAATVLVMAPIAATFAGRLGYYPDAFLMAVAVGAACDFLTPIGHLLEVGAAAVRHRRAAGRATHLAHVAALLAWGPFPAQFITVLRLLSGTSVGQNYRFQSAFASHPA